MSLWHDKYPGSLRATAPQERDQASDTLRSRIFRARKPHAKFRDTEGGNGVMVSVDPKPPRLSSTLLSQHPGRPAGEVTGVKSWTVKSGTAVAWPDSC